MKLVLELNEEIKKEFMKEFKELYQNTIEQARMDVVAVKELLTIEEACDLLNVSRNTLKDNFVRNGLPQYKVGNRIYINKNELYKFVKQYQI